MRFLNLRPQGVLNQFFDDQVLADLVNNQQWSPDLDIIEEKDQYVLRVDLPGIKKEDVKVSVEDGILTIEGERKAEVEHKEAQVHRFERSYGRFVRSLNLGKNIDQDKIQATYKDGVLQLNVPKAQAAKPKAIDIQVS